MSDKAKCKHITPVKCVECTTELNEGSSAIECDICEKRICGECLDLTLVKNDPVTYKHTVLPCL